MAPCGAGGGGALGGGGAGGAGLGDGGVPGDGAGAGVGVAPDGVAALSVGPLLPPPPQPCTKHVAAAASHMHKNCCDTFITPPDSLCKGIDSKKIGGGILAAFA